MAVFSVRVHQRDDRRVGRNASHSAATSGGSTARSKDVRLRTNEVTSHGAGSGVERRM